MIQDLPLYLRGPLKSIRELKLWLCLAYLPCHGMAHRSCGPAVPGPGPVCQYGEHAMRAVLRGYSVETTGTHVTAARSSILMDLPRIPFVLLFFFLNVLASDPFGISVRTNTFSLFVATTARVWCDSHTECYSLFKYMFKEPCDDSCCTRQQLLHHCACAHLLKRELLVKGNSHKSNPIIRPF